jgi:hypothetical protein
MKDGRTFIISEINGEDITSMNVSLDVLDTKKYILVSGLLYPDKDNAYKLSGDFSRYTNSYIKKLSAKQEERIVIYNVNILKGNITEIELYRNKQNIIKKTKFDSVSNEDYKGKNIDGNPNYRFFNLDKKIISKRDIYKLIEDIGENEPNTLCEVHIFSHAYFDGPILVNTQSDENDCDMRRSDIINRIFDMTKFQNAFSNNGIVKIWGCSFPPATNTLYSKFRNNSSYKKENKTDDTIFKFPKNTLWYYKNNVQHTDLTSLINNALNTEYKVNEDVELTFLDIKKILRYNFLNTYASILALYSTISVIAALPATYSNTTSQMKISPDTLENAKMFQNMFNIKLDKDNFGIFDYETVNELQTF